VIAAVLFDLDDTLYPQEAWLDGAWRAVAAAGAEAGVTEELFHRALVAVASEGSDRGRIIDRALGLVGAADDVDIGPLVTAFKRHRPERLDPYPGAVDALERLGRLVRIGLVTDGDPVIQAGKLAALGIGPLFDIVVCSDTLGRARRKPHPAPFLAALDALGVPAAATAYVGDRPDKDVAGALGAGLLPVRVRTGEYRHVPDDPPAAVTVAGVAEAVAFLERRCRRAATAPAS
jgi:putative hydrolase of the HAD superfamily